MQDQFMSQSVHFASQIQQQFKSNSKRIDSGVHQAGFLVLRATTMPSVLVELGFISTPAEEQYLNSAEGSSSMAKSIFNAFLAYKTEQMAREQNATNASAPVVNDSEEVKPIANVKPTSSKGQQEQTIKPTPVKEQPVKAVVTPSDAPVFKIQFLLSTTKLNEKDKRLKGLSPVDYYVENGTYKYTYGASNDYNAVRSKLKEVTAKFKDAFIIAFKQDKKVNVNEAINEFKRNRNK